MKKYWILATILLMVCVGGLFAQTILQRRVVLSGLKGMDVIVEDLNPAGKEIGLSKERIQTDVELKLRLAGIKVLSKEEWLDAKGRPYLYVRVTALKSTTLSLYSCFVEVSLYEQVVLVRDPKIVTSASTCRSGGYIMSGGSDVVKESVRKTIKDLVDEFINDYLAANPKE